MKKLFLIFICLCSLKADINTAVKNMIGNHSYQVNRNLIAFIFKNKNDFYEGSSINYEKVSQTLKNHNLLNLNLAQTSYIDIIFEFSNSSFISLLELKDILKRHGYYYYFTNKVEKKDTLFWEIKLKTQVAISPLILDKELKIRNCRLLDVRKESNNKWYYKINSDNTQVKKAKDLVNNSEISLKKSFKPYMVKIENANAIHIQSKRYNTWYPNIVFYDEQMNILEIYKDDKETESLRLDVPMDTRYIKINDLYSLYNLKRGIYISKE